MRMRPALLSLATVLVLAVSGGAATAVVKNGGPGDDKLTGTADVDTLRGRGGDDKLKGLGGSDKLVGGSGDDLVDGGGGLDELGGGTGNDTISAGADAVLDLTYGGPGDDVIYLWDGDETSAGPGDDRIIATYPSARMGIVCGPGHDTVIFNEEPPDVFLDGCEDVSVVSAG